MTSPGETIWDQIRQALAEGQDPVVKISNQMLETVVRPPEPKRKGVAPKERPSPFSLYSKIPAQGRKTQIYRCWNPYCRKRIDGRYVCDEQCKVPAIEHLEHALSLLRGPAKPAEPEDVPNVQVFDDRGNISAAGVRPREKIRDPRGRKPKGYRKVEQSQSSNGTRKELRKLLSESGGQGGST